MQLLVAQLTPQTRQLLKAFDIQATPPAWRQRLARKKNADARVQSLAGLMLLKLALGQSGQQSLLTDVVIDAHERPVWPQGPAFSIAHSGDWVGCALLESQDQARKVGLDLEQPRALALRHRLKLSAPEQRPQIQNQPALFFRHWCIREAVAKASGQVGLARIRQVRIDTDSAALDQHRWPLVFPKLGGSILACVAVDSGPPPVHVAHVGLQELTQLAASGF